MDSVVCCLSPPSGFVKGWTQKEAQSLFGLVSYFCISKLYFSTVFLNCISRKRVNQKVYFVSSHISVFLNCISQLYFLGVFLVKGWTRKFILSRLIFRGLPKEQTVYLSRLRLKPFNIQQTVHQNMIPKKGNTTSSEMRCGKVLKETKLPALLQYLHAILVPPVCGKVLKETWLPSLLHFEKYIF